MKPESFLEAYQNLKKSSISIRPYVTKKENMGLEKYGMTLFEGAQQEEQLTALFRNGVEVYITGLNEFAPEVTSIKDIDAKEAKIKNIREVVALYEAYVASNILDIKDPEFWSKVKILRPDNKEFWSNLKIRVSNDPLFLDPSDPTDLIKIYAIRAGGFSIVAPSLEAAKRMAKPPKFYLDEFEETVSFNATDVKIKNKAIAALQKIYDKSPNKLFYIAKSVDPNSIQYTKSTPIDLIYTNLSNLIEEPPVGNKKQNAKSFVETCELTTDELITKALIKDGTFYKVLHIKGDQNIYHRSTNTLLGKNPSEVYEYLRNPANESIYSAVFEEVQQYWK